MKASHEWPALDVAKFLCVLMMVFIHSAFALVANGDEQINMANPIVPYLASAALLGIFPMSLPATAGANLRLHFVRYWSGLKIEGYSFVTILKVSIAITLLGFLMNFLAWGAGETFQWDVLQFVGFSFLLITLLLKYTNLYLVYGLGAVTLLLTPWLRTLFAGKDTLLSIFLVGSRLADGYWPFFPWFFIVVFGFFIADLRLRLDDPPWFATVLGLVGLGTVVATLSLGYFHIDLDEGHLWGATIFQPSLGFVVGLAGFFCVLMAGCEWAAARLTFSKYGLVQSFSKGVLWIYLFHVSLAERLGEWVSPRLSPWAGLVLYPGLMAIACWGVGALSLRLGGKRIKIVLARSA